MRKNEQTPLEKCRRAFQIAETEIGVLRVEVGRLEGILADPAH
ncbi:hypothetical protein [Actinoallomurus sp. NPDC050550]